MVSFTRRDLFKSSLGAFAFVPLGVHRYRHDHVLGTSLDLTVSAASQKAADAAHAAACDEIERLRQVLSTYDPSSEISRYEGRVTSPDLARVLAAYANWTERTSGAISARATGTLNVDALGKAYILDRAASAAGASRLLLNIGGDIVARGSWTVGVAGHAENAPPVTRITLRDAAVATSGLSQRGRHIIDPRSGMPATSLSSATVIARDAVTANALATAACVLGAREGLALVERTASAECLIIETDGRQSRSSGFAAYEHPRVVSVSAPAAWPNGYAVVITFRLKEIEGMRVHRPYVAVWAEDASGKLVRNIAVWGRKPRWLPELRTWWSRNDGDQGVVESLTQPTRPPGRYRLEWDGLDDKGRPLPAGAYRITVETNREHGDYAKDSGPIECGSKPGKISLKSNGEFEEVEVEYGPHAGAPAS